MGIAAILFWITVLQTGFQQALPGYQFQFPRDHGSHPEFKLEWWYLTGHLQDSDGGRFGYELTFFRSALARDATGTGSRWRASQLFPAHFAITDIDGKRFHYFEKLNRGFDGIASAAEESLRIQNESWELTQVGSQFRLSADGGDIELQLSLESNKPPVIHGVDGVSQKGPASGQASHYYSMTRLQSTGTLKYEGRSRSVAGTTWMDHEFMSNQLADNQVGWDWISLQLDNDQELMLFQLREAEGGIAPTSAATLVDRVGRSQHLDRDDFRIEPLGHWTSPRTGARYPMNWRISLPSEGVSLTVTTLLEDQELVTTRSTGVTYWEGAVVVEGLFRGQPVAGHGYVELTGYDGKGRPSI